MGDVNEKSLMGGKRKNGHKMDCTCHICQNMKNKAKRNGYEEDIQRENEKKMGGPQKINGHKKDCDCPICRNMRHAKTKKNHLTGGKSKGKKSNGHKPDCDCPICRNMKKKRGGGSEGTTTEAAPTNYPDSNKLGGKSNKNKNKKPNGHKPDCDCPICRNMKKTRKNNKNKKNKTQKR